MEILAKYFHLILVSATRKVRIRNSEFKMRKKISVQETVGAMHVF